MPSMSAPGPMSESHPNREMADRIDPEPVHLLRTSVTTQPVAPKRSVVIINEQDQGQQHEAMSLSVGNEWHCVIHRVESFVDFPAMRLLIVSLNERFSLRLPLDDSRSAANHFVNDYPHFSWYLQSATESDSPNEAEWSTVASASANIHQFISSAHGETFELRLVGTAKTCIAIATISVSWTPPSDGKEPPIPRPIPLEPAVPVIERVDEVEDIEDRKDQTVFAEAETEDNDDPQYLSFSELMAAANGDGDGVNGLNALSLDLGDDRERRFKWRIGIDVRSIGDFAASLSVRCKYQYLLFDGGRWFESNPAIEVRRSEEKAMSDGFCAYEVVLSASALARDLSEYPLTIEFVDGADSVIGYSFIALSHLLSSSGSGSGSGSGSAPKSKLRFIDKYYAIHSLRNEAVLRGTKRYTEQSASALAVSE